MRAQYNDLATNPNLGRLINDSRAAVAHLGLYLGFLAFEAGRRDRANVTLILTVGFVNGLGWAVLQNWQWAESLWPNAAFNWWRCWESCGGISIGIAYGIAYYLVNREREGREESPLNPQPNLERFGVYFGLLLGLGISIHSGFKGWANIYIGNEDYWSRMLWLVIGPLMVIGLVLIVVRIRTRPIEPGYKGDVFPHAGWLIALVLVVQNILAQLVTGPLSNWHEVVFNIYYVLLFLLSAVIVYHYHVLRTLTNTHRSQESSSAYVTEFPNNNT
jgi:hypothetical protein